MLREARRSALPVHGRSPQHCIEYVKLIQWEHEHPDQRDFDADNDEHMRWVYEKALERAKSFGIQVGLFPRYQEPPSTVRVKWLGKQENCTQFRAKPQIGSRT